MSKKIFVAILLSFLCGIFYLLFSDIVFATVGGPTFLSNFVYDGEAGLVYYLSQDHREGGGRSVRQYDIQSGEIKTIITTVGGDYPGQVSEEGTRKLEEFLLSPLPPLPRIDLLKNGIKIETLPTSRNSYHYWLLEKEVHLLNITASIAQNNQEKERIKFRGCVIEETKGLGVNFDGFLVPDSDAVLIVASTTGTCDEGGYLIEKVFPVRGVEIKNRQPLPALGERGFRDAKPSVGGIFINLPIEIENIPLESTEVREEVFDEFTQKQTPKDENSEAVKKEIASQGQQRGIIVLLLIAGATLIIVLFLLYLKKK